MRKRSIFLMGAIGAASLTALTVSLYAAETPRPTVTTNPPATTTAAPAGRPSGPTASPFPPAPVLLPPPAPGIVASVNGSQITKAELVTDLLKKYGQTDLEQLIDRRIVEEAAKKQGIVITPKDIQDTYNSIQFSSGPALASYEQRYGKDFVIANVIRPEIIQKKLAEKLVTFNPADLDEVQASHILIRPVPATDAAGKAKADADAKAKADEVYQKAIAPGADFAALASQYSEDPGSKSKGGDLGFFSRGQMVPQFDEAAFNAKVGDIVGPVKTDYGYHIIKVVGRKSGSSLSPAELESKKTQFLIRKANEPINAWLDRQRKTATVLRYQMDTTTAAPSTPVVKKPAAPGSDQ